MNIYGAIPNTNNISMYFWQLSALSPGDQVVYHRFPAKVDGYDSNFQGFDK